LKCGTGKKREECRKEKNFKGVGTPNYQGEQRVRAGESA